MTTSIRYYCTTPMSPTFDKKTKCDDCAEPCCASCGCGDCSFPADPPLPNWIAAVSLTVNNQTYSVVPKDFILHRATVDWYSWCVDLDLVVNGYSRNFQRNACKVNDYLCNQTYNFCKTKKENGVQPCDFNICGNDDTNPDHVLWKNTWNKRAKDWDCSLLQMNPKSRGISNKDNECFSGSSSGLDGVTTCALSQVRGLITTIDDITADHMEGSSDYWWYRQGKQWRARVPDTDWLNNNTDTKWAKGDALCHYRVPDFQSLCGTFYDLDSFPNPCPKVNNLLGDWEIQKETLIARFSDRPYRILRLILYLYTYTWIFYNTLFVHQKNLNWLDIRNSDTFLRILVETTVRLPYGYATNDKKTILQNKLRQVLRYPQPVYDSTTNTYGLNVYMHFEGFNWVASADTIPQMNGRIGQYLTHFFQSTELQVLVNQVPQTEPTATYKILGTFGLAITDNNTTDSFEWDHVVFEQKNDPFGYDESLITVDGFWTWFSSNNMSLYVHYQFDSPLLDYNAVLGFRVQITGWDPILLSYYQEFKPGTRFDSPLCTTLYDQLSVLPVQCDVCRTSLSTECKQQLPKLCSTLFLHPNPSINKLLQTNIISQSSYQDQCGCFSNHLGPPARQQFGDPVSMCFDSHCSQSDRDLVGASDAFCKANCSTVYNWMYPRSPADASENPGELDTTRYTGLCGPLRSMYTFNWNMFLNCIAIMIFLCIIVYVLCLKTFRTQGMWMRRRWIYASLVVCLCLGIGVSIFIGLDQACQSFCPATVGKPSLCRTAITDLPMPSSNCAHQYCQCFFNEDCFQGCKCSSGLCTPADGSAMPTQSKAIVRLNVPLLVSACTGLVMGCCMVYAYWDRIQASAKWSYGIIVLGMALIILAVAMAIRNESETQYTSSCGTSIAVVLGNFFLNATQLTLPDDRSLLTNLVIMEKCVGTNTDTTPTLAVINTNMYVTTTVTVPYIISSQPILGSSSWTRNVRSFTPSDTQGAWMALIQYGRTTFDGWTIQFGETSGSTTVTIHFDDAFETPPFVFVDTIVPLGLDNVLLMAQLVQITTDDCTCAVYQWDTTNKRWIPYVEEQTPGIVILWTAFGRSVSSSLPSKQVVVDSGSLLLQTQVFSALYASPPAIVTTVNTTDPSILGCVILRQREVDRISWDLWIYDTSQSQWTNQLPTSFPGISCVYLTVGTTLASSMLRATPTPTPTPA